MYYDAEREAYESDVEELSRDANAALEDFNVEHGTDMQVVALNDEELELTDGGKSIIFSNLGKLEAYLAARHGSDSSGVKHDASPDGAAALGGPHHSR